MMSNQRFGIACMFIVGYFGVLALMVYEREWAIVREMITVQIVTLPLILKWYYDSSHGSERKTELLAQSQPLPVPPAPLPEKGTTS